MTDPPHDTSDEAEILKRVSGGCESSFRTLYRRHTTPLYRLALRLSGGRTADAEEAVQETWRRAVSGAATFGGRSSVRTWLKGILVHVSLERVRRERRDRPEGASDRSMVRETPSGPGSSNDHRAAVRIDLARAVADLAPGYRAVLVLHDLEGYRHAEIGQVLGISPGTSKSQLSRARRQVRKALGDDYAGGG